MGFLFVFSISGSKILRTTHPRMDKPTPEILTFASTGPPGPSNSMQPITSHLASRSRSDSSHSKINVKRIKPNKQARIDNDNRSLQQLEATKIIVHEVIEDVLSDRPLKYGYSFYYQKVETVCRYKHIEQSKLGDHIRNRITERFMTDTLVKYDELFNDDAVGLNEFVVKFLQLYQNWENKLRLLSKLFLYLDRNYLLQHPNKKVILELGLQLYVDNLLSPGLVQGKITIKNFNSLMHKCQMEDKDWDLLETITKVLIKLNYGGNLKFNIVEQSITTFNVLKDQWIKDSSTYINKVLSKISKTVTFFKNCGYKPIDDLLIKLKWTTIFTDFDHIILQCLPYILQDNSLLVVYKFCEVTPKEYSLNSMNILSLEWGKLILNRTNELIESELVSGNSQFIKLLLDEYNYYKSIVDSKFNGDENFEFEIRRAFNKAVNHTKRVNSFVISNLCKFSDQFFKNKSKFTYDDFAAIFMTIFKFLNNKNDFITNYKNQLSKRLLVNKSSSVDTEKKLVDSIIDIVGENDDSVGLAVMFKDLASSQETYFGLRWSKVEFNALILEKKHWPDVPKLSHDVNLPDQFQSILAQFKSLYVDRDDKFKNHALHWDNYNLHQVTIEANFASGTYELNVNLLQAIMIDLFNVNDELTVSEIHEKTNLEPKFIKKLVNSLSDKFKILIDEGSVVKYNHEFSDKSKKLRIPLPRDKDTSSGSNLEEKVVLRNRDVEIRSIIIRLMKHHMQCPFSDLINETLQILKKAGPVPISTIKANIEFLIAKEYVERLLDNTTLAYIP